MRKRRFEASVCSHSPTPQEPVKEIALSGFALTRAAPSVLPEPAQVTVRNGAYSGFSCVPEDIDLYLQMAEARSTAPLRILVGRDDGTDYTALQRPMELVPGRKSLGLVRSRNVRCQRMAPLALLMA